MDIVNNIYKHQYSDRINIRMPNIKTVFEKLYETKTKDPYHYVWYVFPYNVNSSQNQFLLKYPKNLEEFNDQPQLVTNLIKASLLFLLISNEENKTLKKIFGRESDDDIKFMNCLLLFYLFYYENKKKLNSDLYKLFEHFIKIAYNNQQKRYKDNVFNIYLINEEPKIDYKLKYYIFNNIIKNYNYTKMRTLYKNARDLIIKITNSNNKILKYIKYKGNKDFTDSITNLNISGFLLDNNYFKNSKNIFFFSTRSDQFINLIKTKIDDCNDKSKNTLFISLKNNEVITYINYDPVVKYCFKKFK